MTPEEIAKDCARIEALLEEKFAARRGPLRRRLAKAGRRLPRHVRRAGEEMCQAGAQARHPGLAKRIAPARYARARRILEQHLKAVDRADMRRGLALNLGGTLAFNLLLWAALLVGALLALGHI